MEPDNLQEKVKQWCNAHPLHPIAPVWITMAKSGYLFTKGDYDSALTERVENHLLRPEDVPIADAFLVSLEGVKMSNMELREKVQKWCRDHPETIIVKYWQDMADTDNYDFDWTDFNDGLAAARLDCPKVDFSPEVAFLESLLEPEQSPEEKRLALREAVLDIHRWQESATRVFLGLDTVNRDVSMHLPKAGDSCPFCGNIPHKEDCRVTVLLLHLDGIVKEAREMGVILDSLELDAVKAAVNELGFNISLLRSLLK